MRPNVSGMQEDLNRTRRLVSAMRSVVQSSSVHRAVLRDIEMHGEKKQKQLEVKVVSNSNPLTPRARYLREYQVQRVRLIQHQWKLSRVQKIIQVGLVIERKYRSRIGVRRYEHAAAEIQRRFRGFRVRSHCGGDLVKWFRRTQDDPHFHTSGYQRFLRLQEERLNYFGSWGKAMEELEISHKYLAKLEKTQVHTRHKVLVQIQLDQRQESQQSVEGGEGPSSPPVALIFVDTDLMDGVNSRVEAQKLLKYIDSELIKTKNNIQMQQKTLLFIQKDHPLRHHAATRIAARIKTFVVLQHFEQMKKKQKEKQFRILLSKHNCNERMNAALAMRQLQRAHEYATTIQSFWRMILAKRHLLFLRKQKAARYILQVYRGSCQVPLARQRLNWLLLIRQAQKWRLIQVRHRLRHLWKRWWQAVLLERGRQLKIKLALHKGQEKWISMIAVRLQHIYRLVFEKRLQLSTRLQKEIDSRLEFYLNKQQQGQESDFFDQVQADFRCFQAQFDDKTNLLSQHFQLLATRYHLHEDHMGLHLPIEKMWTWYRQLKTRRIKHKETFFSLYNSQEVTFSILPTRTLKMLQELNGFYRFTNDLAIQRLKILSLYESKMVMRDYIKSLFAFDRIELFQASTNLRRLAMEKLDQTIHLEKFTSISLGSPLRSNSHSLYGPILENGHVSDGESLVLAGSGQGTGSHEEVSGRFMNFHAAAHQRRTVATNSTSVSLQEEFSLFHSVWSDLCEKCLVLRPRRLTGTQSIITCSVCGHANYARQTATSILMKTTGSNPTKSAKGAQQRWFHPEERCDFLVLNAFFHAFAPFGHINRQYEVESVWKIAMANALPFVNALYERNCCTLNDLMVQLHHHPHQGHGHDQEDEDDQEDKDKSIWKLLPAPVARKLHQFLTILHQEMINLSPNQLHFPHDHYHHQETGDHEHHGNRSDDNSSINSSGSSNSLKLSMESIQSPHKTKILNKKRYIL